MILERSATLSFTVGCKASPLFENSEMLLREVEVSNSVGQTRAESLACTCVSNPGEKGAYNRTRVTLSEDSIARPGGFNCNFGALVVASLAVAVLVPERFPNMDDLTSRQAEHDLLPSANSTNHSQ